MLQSHKMTSLFFRHYVLYDTVILQIYQLIPFLSSPTFLSFFLFEVFYWFFFFFWPHHEEWGILVPCMHVRVLSCFSPVWLFVTPWTVACKASLSMGFSRQESWSGLPFPAPGDLPDPRDQAGVSHIAGRFFTVWATRENHWFIHPKWVNCVIWELSP